MLDASTRRPSISISAARSSSSPSVVAIVARAEVAGGVERLAAQRARGPARGDHAAGAVDEIAHPGRGQADPEPVEIVADRGDLGRLLLFFLFGEGLGGLVDGDRLDDDRVVFDVEGEPE